MVLATLVLLGGVGVNNAAAQTVTAAGAQLAIPDAGPGTSVGWEGYYFFDCDYGSDLSSLPGYATVTDLANGYTGGDYSYLVVDGRLIRRGSVYVRRESGVGDVRAGAPATVRLAFCSTAPPRLRRDGGDGVAQWCHTDHQSFGHGAGKQRFLFCGCQWNSDW